MNTRTYNPGTTRICIALLAAIVCFLPGLTGAASVICSRDAVLDDLAEKVEYLPIERAPGLMNHPSSRTAEQQKKVAELAEDPEVRKVVEDLRTQLREAGSRVLPETVSYSSPARADYFAGMVYQTDFDDPVYNRLAIEEFLRRYAWELDREKAVPPLAAEHRQAVNESVKGLLDSLQQTTLEHLGFYYTPDEIKQEFDRLDAILRMHGTESTITTALRKPLREETRVRLEAEYEKRILDSLDTIDSHLGSVSREGVGNDLPAAWTRDSILKRIAGRIVQAVMNSTLDDSIAPAESLGEEFRSVSSAAAHRKAELMEIYQRDLLQRMGAEKDALPHDPRR